ncbi:uncharacterized protein LOC111778157 isoform X1 [Cucurbita pepo subsp. pepo]|uniref:uncharacterized protein LOC111778157 isoform X1 n=1 Tax=Cucurbita pepo subsp. pepo TaxID=3664 RepID=UPI000C9D61CC|nr:uncharacterized protein LOC111778157 isoform X1 [Cucurbita pepo subsp. pepo]XP_023513600.1 uncharacterized protein LOC111778157 isoform X1 [Cucurbita pepo subsp. pepo]XP_023513601.1 uncharacterized protein LOC111778157 isoform X1 [Cucurbita pepo subsp. pepo]
MRLRKGDQVEVYSQEEVSSGSWSCAEIVSGNGRTYSVRYFQTEEAVEKVPRWAIRPCPPPVEGPNVWAAGDLAEAFHNSSWKQARIMQIIGVNCYLARLLGSPLDVLVSQSYLRLRQAWRDGQWFLLGKAFEDLGSLPGNKQTVPDMVKSKVQQLVTALPTRHQRRPLLEKSKKHTVSILKRKITKKDVTYLPSLAKTTKLCLTRELSRVRLSSTFPAVNTEVATGYVGLREDNLIPRTSNYIHTVSCASSVGSNNSTDDFFKVPFNSVARSKQVKDEDYCSDAESFTGRGHEEENSCSDEEVSVGFHRSELSVFRSFIRVLYASGPLSWEDEGQVSSIRASLHISNDEYLTELKNLMSAAKKTSV